MSTIEERRATSALWHPFEDQMRVASREVVMERGSGIWLWDVDGRRYLDGSAGLWYANVGHGRHEIAAAIAAQLGRLETHHAFGDYATPPARELAARLSRLAPAPDSSVFLVSGGGDAIDTAAKLVRRHWQGHGHAERRHIISRTGGYHGTHGFGTSLAGIPSNRAGYGPLVTDVSSVQYDSVDGLAAEIDRVGPERVAAFLFEPVIASGGVLPPPPGYLEEVTRICREHGILTIADSVVCGFGRLGTWFGAERWGLAPDMIVFAKGVTSGYLPLGGVVVSGAIAEPFRDGRLSFRHGATYSAHSTCCAAALANLDLLEREELLARSIELESVLEAEFSMLRDHELVETTRAGVGLLAAFDLRRELVEAHPGIVADALAAARAAGVLTRPLERGLAIAPPLVIARDELRLVVDRLRMALDALAELVARGELPLLPPAEQRLSARFGPLPEDVPSTTAA